MGDRDRLSARWFPTERSCYWVASDQRCIAPLGADAEPKNSAYVCNLATRLVSLWMVEWIKLFSLTLSPKGELSQRLAAPDLRV
jgi:hypothetical protein